MIPLTAANVLENASFRGHVMAALKTIPVRIVLDQVGFGVWHLFREKLERLQPDVILVDLAGQPEQRFACIQQIRTMSRPPAVVVFHDTHDATVTLNAMRWGRPSF